MVQQQFQIQFYSATPQDRDLSRGGGDRLSYLLFIGLSARSYLGLPLASGLEGGFDPRGGGDRLHEK